MLRLNLALVAALVIVGVTAHSLGVLAAGVDYLADAAAIAVSLFAQRFARSSQPASSKRAFMNDLPNRRVADGLLVLCGESNIASMVQHSDFTDPFGFTDRLREMNIGPILNPIHDWMRRSEMKKKRRGYSVGGRTVISVWNQGRRGEELPPWTVFHDGRNRTTDVRALPTPFSDRPDIRIGVLDLKSL